MKKSIKITLLTLGAAFTFGAFAAHSAVSANTIYGSDSTPEERARADKWAKEDTSAKATHDREVQEQERENVYAKRLGVKPTQLYPDYATVTDNPVTVKVKAKSVRQYKDVRLKQATKKVFKKGQTFTAVRVVKLAYVTRYQLANGNYVTANQWLAPVK